MVCLEESLNAEIRELHKKNEDLEEEHREELQFLKGELAKNNRAVILEQKQFIFLKNLV